MSTWVMFFILMLTGSQCNHISPTQEADLEQLRTSTEVEQMEVRHWMAMEGVENKEGWLTCVMLKGSSWGTEEAFF